MSFDDEVGKLEDLLAGLEQRRQQLESNPDRAVELLEEMNEEAKATIDALDRARRAAELEAATAPTVDPDAPAT